MLVEKLWKHPERKQKLIQFRLRAIPVGRTAVRTGLMDRVKVEAMPLESGKKGKDVNGQHYERDDGHASGHISSA